MWNEPDFDLAALDPRAQVAVITDAKACESIFTSGNGIRQHWEDGRIQRVHQLNTPPSANPEFPWHRCLCPDGSTIFIKFLSLETRLLDGHQLNQPQSEPDMPEQSKTKKKSPPPRKPVTKAPPAKAPAKPAAKTPPPAKPVAAPKAATPKPVAAPKTSTTTKPVKAPKPEGNYKWLLHRLKAQVTAALSTGDNRGVIREGLKTANKFTEIRAFLTRAGVTEGKFDEFLDVFFNASINRPSVKE